MWKIKMPWKSVTVPASIPSFLYFLEKSMSQIPTN